MSRSLRICLTLCLAVAAVSCDGTGDGSDTDAGKLTVYSGRNERLIGPLLEQFTEKTGIDVKVRYGGTSELTATLLEEGAGSPADLFISQDAAALGALSREQLLKPVPAEILERVSSQFRSPAGDWVGLSGRARVVVYNTDRITPEELPQSLEAVTDPRFKGRFGLAPGNASFQAHMAVYFALNGAERTQALLEGMVANEPLRYPKNTPIVTAVIAGEIDWGLVNHYYLLRALDENPEAPAKIFFMTEGSGSSFMNMAGAAMLRETENATKLLDYLLSDDAQTYFADGTHEYPLAGNVAAQADLPSVEAVDVDYGAVSEALEGTLRLINDTGLIGFQ